jgi:short-subunit dehydrogenase|tara:strand:- start:1037 stop:1780 length:744 start_codon:yes stop_codon:yes gene_type:complete
MKKYWIIGSSSGIGKELAKKLDAKGYELILSSRNHEKLNELNSTLINNHEVIPLDLSDKNQCLKVSKNIINKEIDSLHIIFMSATYSPDDSSDYENVINVNILGLLHILSVTKEFLKNTNDTSQLIICSSLVAYKGLPYSQPYSMTKAALYNLASSLHIELKNIVDVKVITPGFVKTPLTDKNNFPMPLIISASSAASIIAKGMVSSKKFEISFPLPMYLIMKGLQTLPNFISNYISSLVKKGTDKI